MSQIYKAEIDKKIKLPLYYCTVSAGFPSPADDYIDKKLDLNEYIIKHPASTFLVKVRGNSMQDCGISNDDLLVVDRSLDPIDKSIVVAFLDGEFTIKRVRIKKEKLYLVPENTDYKSIEVTKEMDFQVWGVVTHAIKSIK
jgi:DNA polymerase V